MTTDMKREDFPYASHFCEENIYHLATKLTEEDDVGYFVVFVSSLAKRTPIWHQRLSHDQGKPVVWDYHVILVQKATTGAKIIDFDTSLDFSSDAHDYASRCFRPQEVIPQQLRQRFRVVEADHFLGHFASDRSHMDPLTVEFPSWQSIKGPIAETSMNLNDFIDVEDLGQSEM